MNVRDPDMNIWWIFVVYETDSDEDDSDSDYDSDSDESEGTSDGEH